MSANFKNNSRTRLVQPLEQGATTAYVADAAQLPTAPFRAQIERELVHVTSVVGNALTLTRGEEGTEATWHASRSTVRGVVSAQALRDLFSDLNVYNAAEYGADPAATGVVNAAAIVAAITAANVAGGGDVLIPAGTYLLASLGDNTAIGISGMSGIRIRGAGVGATTIRLAAGGNAHIFSVFESEYITIEDMTLDGNRLNQSLLGTHCIRGQAVDGIWLNRLHIKNSPGYGIGLQSTFKKHCFLTNLIVEDSQADNIDVKNTGDSNAHCVINNVTLGDFDLGMEGDKSGLDLRGPWQVSNVTVRYSSGTGAPAGVRCRNGELLEANGYGAHHTHLTNIEVYANAVGTGIALVARDCKLTNAFVSGGLTGIGMYDDGCRVTQVTVEDAITVGISVDAAADGCEIHGARVVGSATANGATIAGARAKILGGLFTGCANGISVTGVGCRVVGAESYSNTGDGLFIQEAATDICVSACDFHNNGDEGISLRADRASITGCTFEANTSRAIDVEATADNGLIAGNLFGPTTSNLQLNNASTWVDPNQAGLTRIVSNNTTAWTLDGNTQNRFVRANNGSAITITVPLNSSVPFPDGTTIEIEQTGAGAVTLSPTGGVTLNGTLSTAAQWQRLHMRKVGTDVWDVVRT